MIDKKNQCDADPFAQRFLSKNRGLSPVVYIADNSGDRVIELADEGVDLVDASVSYALAANDCEWRSAA